MLCACAAGSPLLQSMGLQCLNAHFNSFDLNELSTELMQMPTKWTQAAKQKGSTLLNSLLAVLSSLAVPPVATKEGYKGHLKSMWDATVEVSKYVNHSLDEWMQWCASTPHHTCLRSNVDEPHSTFLSSCSLFTAAAAGSTTILGVLMQKDADVCKVMQAWGMEEGLQVLTACAREWESCGNITGVFDTLLPRSTQTPNQPTCPTEEVETTAENDGVASEFLDVMFLLIRQQVPASQFGVLMTRILKYLGVAHCRHPPHPPSIVKEATALCKERVELFVANWGPAAVVDLMDKRKEELRSGEAINMLRSE